MTAFTPLAACLACGGGHLVKFCDFGEQPLANGFHAATSRKEPRYPLALNVCDTCWHVQQSGFVDPALIYRNYPYSSGTSDTLRAYFNNFVARVEADMAPYRAGPLVVLEIAANDGSLLREFSLGGHFTVGVDPAENLHDSLIENCDVTLDAMFWSKETAETIRDELKLYRAEPDVIVAMNVLAHVADPLGFLMGCKAVLRPGGRIYVQTSQANMLVNGEFDTCYHEHISQFCGASFLALAARAGLVVDRISLVPIHGESYLVEMVADESPFPDERDPVDARAFSVLLDEKLNGYYDVRAYRAFRERVDMHIDHAATTVEFAKRLGYRVVGYGAAAKGMNFLGISGIAPEFVVDNAPLKIGQLCPGGDIPVVGPDDMRLSDQQPILWLILAWNFASEIKARIKQRRPTAKDRFMTCFPTVTTGDR